jgi:hypothetical protein
VLAVEGDRVVFGLSRPDQTASVTGARAAQGLARPGNRLQVRPPGGMHEDR